MQIKSFIFCHTHCLLGTKYYRLIFDYKVINNTENIEIAKVDPRTLPYFRWKELFGSFFLSLKTKLLCDILFSVVLCNMLL